MDAPPVETVYQFTVPAQPVTDNATVPVPHLDPGTAIGAAGIGLIVAITGVLLLSHPFTVHVA